MAMNPPSTLEELDALDQAGRIVYSDSGHPKYLADDATEVYLHIYRPLFEEIESVARSDAEVLELCRRPGKTKWLRLKRKQYRE